MTALDKDKPRNTRGTPLGGPPMTVAATTTIHAGALISRTAAGHVVPATDTAGEVCMGEHLPPSTTPKETSPTAKSYPKPGTSSCSKLKAAR